MTNPLLERSHLPYQLPDFAALTPEHYREAFETVLFYRALWSQGQHPAILAGMGVAAAAMMLSELPIRHMRTALFDVLPERTNPMS